VFESSRPLPNRSTGNSDRRRLEATAIFELRGGEVTAFDVSFELLRHWAGIVPGDAVASGRSVSVVVMLFVGFPVHRVGLLLLGSRVSHDAEGAVLVAVRGMIDQFLLAQLEAL